MRTTPTPRPRIAGAVACLAVLLLLALPAAAEDLTVASYVDLTIDRLQLAYTTWSEENRSPVETEEAEVCQAYATNLDDYYAFAGKNAAAIEDYLAQNTAKRDTIESLAADIAAIIEGGEQ